MCDKQFSFHPLSNFQPINNFDQQQTMQKPCILMLSIEQCMFQNYMEQHHFAPGYEITKYFKFSCGYTNNHVNESCKC